MPYPANITPLCTFEPIANKVRGISRIFFFGFIFLKGRGRAGTPAYSFSGGSFFIRIGRTEESSSPLLQRGQVKNS